MLQFQDILIIKSLDKPIKLVKNPSGYTSLLLSTLIQSDNFQQVIERWPKLYEVNTDNRYNDIFTTSLWTLKKEYKKDISLWERIVEDCKLPYSFTWYIFLLVKYHACIDITMSNNPAIYPVHGEVEVINKLKSIKQNREVHDIPDVGDFIEPVPLSTIFIEQYLTKSQFLKWISANWKLIEPGFQKLPKVPFNNWKFSDVALANEIATLSKQGKSVKDICDTLREKYPKNSDVAGEQWVRNKLTRFLEVIEQFQTHLQSTKNTLIPLASFPDL